MVMDWASLSLSPADHHQLIHFSSCNQVSGVFVGAEVSILSPVRVITAVLLKETLHNSTITIAFKFLIQVSHQLVDGVVANRGEDGVGVRGKGIHGVLKCGSHVGLVGNKESPNLR